MKEMTTGLLVFNLSWFKEKNLMEKVLPWKETSLSFDNRE